MFQTLPWLLQLLEELNYTSAYKVLKQCGFNNFTLYNNSSENSSKAVVHKTKEENYEIT